MKIVLAQPAIKYYTWQLEVTITSLIQNKVDPHDIHIVCGKKQNKVDQGFDRLMETYPQIVWAFYHDNRPQRSREYIPSIRPHILKKHWRKHPELQDEVIFYMEADTILTKPIPEKFKLTDKWFLSDTASYIGHDYIVDRDPRFLDLFCSIVQLDKEIVKANQKGSGGAQYVMKGLTEQYWDKVEKDCVEIYHQGSALNQRILKEKPDWKPLQIWTACMWAHLWNAWKMGHETECPKELDFTWANDDIKKIKKNGIYHNAGVMPEHTDVMRKHDFRFEFPYGKKMNINPKKAGAYYWAKIQEVGKNSCLK